MESNLVEPKSRASTPIRRCLGHILIVDDEAANRLLLRDPLEARGYEVTEASNGLEALRAISTRPPDAILLDVMMPGMDGFQLCRRLKLDRQTAPIPTLLVTALADREERLLGMKAGANDFLNKPVDVQDLILRVGNAVYAKSLYDQLQVERSKSDRLLLNMLPPIISDRLRQGDQTVAEHYSEAGVLVADLADFTGLTSHLGPAEIVSLLNEVFSAFDLLAEEYGLEKIKTIGDAYMAAAGVPYYRRDYASALAEMALAMQTEVVRFNQRFDTSLRLRISIHTGPLIAGVIGRRRCAYDLWGDTVNVVCSLDAFAAPDTILASGAAYELLKDDFRFGGQRQVELKKHRQITVYNLLGAAE